MVNTVIEALSKTVRFSDKEVASVFSKVSPETASELIQTFEEESKRDLPISAHRKRVTYNATNCTLRVLIMPTRIHESPASWLAQQPLQWAMNGLLPANFITTVSQLPSPLIKAFVGRYAGSLKEPDYCFWPRGLSYPSIVLETGYSESWDMLLEDQAIWSEGTSYQVSIVILVKVGRPNAAGAVTAKCSVTMFDLNGLSRVFTEILLPRPQNPLCQISITYSQLYRETLPQGVLAHGQISLDLDLLRDTLEHAVRSEGLSIAA